VVQFKVNLKRPRGDAQRRPQENSARSHHAVIRVYDADGNVIETYEHVGDFKEV